MSVTIDFLNQPPPLQGYDAFAMCTMIDPMFRELKTIVDIPVVVAGETCFHLASINGYAPSIAVEFGRKVLYSSERPGFAELEAHVKLTKS